jgi:hypothetical protein
VGRHREEWSAEVDAALEKAIAAERKAYEKAMATALKARERRQHLETFASWVRRLPPVWSPPGDVAVQGAFGQLAADTDRAERQMRERAENERLEHEANAARERAEREAAEEGAA